jgi:hypothetical protein
MQKVISEETCARCYEMREGIKNERREMAVVETEHMVRQHD